MPPHLVDPDWYASYWYGEPSKNKLNAPSAVRWAVLSVTALLSFVVLRA